MQSIDYLQITRAMVADVLALELDEVQPHSRFFPDLHGESIDLLELSFMIEVKYKFKVEFGRIFASDMIETDAAGVITTAALDRIRTALPFLDFHRLPPRPTPESFKQELLTVAAIAEFVRQAAASLPSTQPLLGTGSAPGFH